MEKTLKTLDQMLATDSTVWSLERKFWFNSFTRVQKMQNGGRILNRIAGASRDNIDDYLFEVWYTVLFSELGFKVIVEPLGKAGPDLKIKKNGHSGIVEVTSFRRMYEGPPEISIDDEEFVFAEYGDSRRDVEKAFNKIIGKFSQINMANTNTSIIAIWNSDGDIEEVEMKAAVKHLLRDKEANRVFVPASLAFILFAPWDDKFWCFPVRSSLTLYEREWIEKFEEITIGQFKGRILNPP